jgi:hypothetical protein
VCEYGLRIIKDPGDSRGHVTDVCRIPIFVDGQLSGAAEFALGTSDEVTLFGGLIDGAWAI